jgi:hypothetical protein
MDFVNMFIKDKLFSDLGLSLHSEMLEVKTKKLEDPLIYSNGKTKSINEFRRHKIHNSDPLSLQ